MVPPPGTPRHQAGINTMTMALGEADMLNAPHPAWLGGGRCQVVGWFRQVNFARG